MANYLNKILLLERIKWQKDGVFDSLMYSKFINKLMHQGKKAQIEKIIYNVLGDLKHEYNKLLGDELRFIVENMAPEIKLIPKTAGRGRKRRRRLNFKQLYIPLPIPIRKQYVIALSWLVNAIKTNYVIKTKPIKERLLRLRSRGKKMRYSFIRYSHPIEDRILKGFRDFYSNNPHKTSIFGRRNYFYRQVSKNRAYVHYRWS